MNPSLENAIVQARLYRHKKLSVSPALRENIRILLGFIEMRKAGIFRAIYCNNCESKRGFFVDLETHSHEPAVPQFISWENATKVLSAFEELQRKPMQVAQVLRKAVNR